MNVDADVNVDVNVAVDVTVPVLVSVPVAVAMAEDEDGDVHRKNSRDSRGNCGVWQCQAMESTCRAESSIMTN